MVDSICSKTYRTKHLCAVYKYRVGLIVLRVATDGWRSVDDPTFATLSIGLSVTDNKNAGAEALGWDIVNGEVA